ncbi:PLDc N-terminal domain-containing protein [Salsuginibacillus kocurii]|uniref:PLDc N-terminal domain-containing protein n=1 Tax=Salsuginibacillus kocurii TaxID=427078 RepID=UPI00036FBB71|nr:PLDc N-terminal domain-containing protein [Salsuginibacillus kocurii]
MLEFGMATLFLMPLLIFLLLFILNIITSIWAYKDSIRRGNSKEYALLILLGTLFFPILGLIIYLLIRNK